MKFKIPKEEFKGDISDYPLENYPDYEPGKPPRFERIHAISHLEEVERVWGQQWGEQGVGRLRDVALVRPTKHEINPLFLKEPAFFMLRHYLRTERPLNIEKMQEQHDAYAKILKDNGVKVRYMQFEDDWGAYGPLRKHFVAGRLGMVIRGGVIIKRWGHASWNRGLERHAMKFFISIGCPILLYPTGRAVFEGTWVFPAENIAMGSYGIACNEEAMEQIRPVIKAAGIEQVIMGGSTTIMDSLEWGGDFHIDSVLNIVDLGIALAYPAQVDWRLYHWLKENRFKIIEVPRDEVVECEAVNGMPLGDGKIVMPSTALKTNSMLRREGIDVIELDTSGLVGGGLNGLRCITCRLYREPGPRLEEIKK